MPALVTPSTQTAKVFQRGVAPTRAARVELLGEKTALRFGDFLPEYWDLDTSTFIGTFDSSPQVATAEDLDFGNGGLKMYVLERTGFVFEYDCPTSYDFLNAVYTGNYLDVSAIETSARGVKWNRTGTKIRVSGNAQDSVFTWDATVPWSLATGNNALIESYDASAIVTNLHQIDFSYDQDLMFIISPTSDEVHPFSLSTPDVVTSSTVTYLGDPLDLTPWDSAGLGLSMRRDGFLLRFIGNNTNTLYQLPLLQKYVVNSVDVPNVKSFDMTTFDGAPSGVYSRPLGNKYFITGRTSDSVHGFAVSA